VTVEGVSVDVAFPCTILGGRNGTGKSRILRALNTELGARSVYINLHALCEQTLDILRSRTDVKDLKDEVEAMSLTADQIDDMHRIINREYDRFDWYGLDVVPGDLEVAERFSWGADQPTVPYFEASYRGIDYDSRSMGLGELSVHLLFWILQQHDQTESLILLIDEPDAYLPPLAASVLLARLLKVITRKQRKWRLVITTHSADIISAAVAHDSFLFLEVGEDGILEATPSRDDPHISELLLARPEIRHVIFVEDESAYHLARALILGMDRRVSGSISLVWGNGFGYMRGLQEHLPQARHQDIGYMFVFDGDQRPSIEVPAASSDTSEESPTDEVAAAHSAQASQEGESSEWQAVYLPTHADPDKLFKSLASSRPLLAERLGRSMTELNRVLSTLEGKDPHDWVNGLARGIDRPHILAELAALWIELHPSESGQFRDDLSGKLLALPHRH
jgi:predicted ATPase